MKIQNLTEIATEKLRAGEVIALPSDTVFALVCAKIGLPQLYKIKQRDINKPTQILVSSVQKAMQLATFTPLAMLYLDEFSKDSSGYVVPMTKVFT